MKQATTSEDATPRSEMTYALGIVLLVVSCLFWIGPFVVPFMPLSVTQKAGVIAGLLIAAEAMFWLGALLVGKEAMKKIKRRVKLDKSQVTKS